MQDQQAVRAVLAAGLTWLFDTVQPDGAIVTHHGPNHAAGQRFRLAFAPLKAPVVIVYVSDPRYEDKGASRALLNALTEDEMRGVASLLAELGRPPIDQWNGAGGESGSFRLVGPLHPSLDAACARYRADCPVHNTVFCGQREGCTWLKDGSGLVVEPSWPDLAAV